jgi:poly(A) polymerase
VEALRCAKEIVQELRGAGHRAYFAGGWVRDYLLGIKSQDIDIATDADPDEIVSIFPEHVLVGAQFGVVLVLYKDFQFEVATFRKDLAYEDGRKPSEVSLKSSPEEDALRRDFTINGMFFDPVTETVYDFVGGKADLEKKVIRTIGKPEERFSEDRLRMIRAVRFAFRFGFSLDEDTKRAIRELSATLLPAVSMERIWQELNKMREGPSFKEALKKMHKLNLLQTIFPQLSNVSLDELEIRLQGIELLSPHVPSILFLARLFGDSEESFVKLLHQHLRASKEDGKWLEAYIELKKIPLSALFNLEPYKVAHLLANSRTQVCLEVLTCGINEKEKESFRTKYEAAHHHLDSFIHRIRKKDPVVKAKDLQEAGVLPGIKMGKLLAEAERISINHHLTDKEQVLHKLKEMAEW